tara:strand:- start:125 stop:274 length:150 start_codon:yes stop_codon:yes gene_type:complete
MASQHAEVSAVKDLRFPQNKVDVVVLRTNRQGNCLGEYIIQMKKGDFLE